MNRTFVLVSALLLVIILIVRFLANNDRKPDPLHLAQTVAATERKQVDAQEAVKVLPPRPPPEKEVPAEPAPAQLATWHTVSKDGRARVEQTSTDGMRCTTRCEVSGAITWSRNGCISKNGEFRFTSGDCDCLIVLRVAGEGSWRYSPVLLIYRRGRLEKSLAAGDFISDESTITHVGDVFDWLKSGGHVIADSSGIEFETRDGRKQHILFAAEVK